jgi:hypothetical protein
MASLPVRHRAPQQRSKASTDGPPASPNSHSVQSWWTESLPRDSLYCLGGAWGSRTMGAAGADDGGGGDEGVWTLLNIILLTLADING